MKFLLTILACLACLDCGYASLPNTTSSLELPSRSNPDISPRATAKAKKVFGYYLLSAITEAHAHLDIDNAISMGLDGFALAIGDPSQAFVDESLGYLFGYANYRGFHLYFTLDVFAAGNACSAGMTGACGGPSAYQTILQNYLGQASYYWGPNDFPLISTHSSGGLTHDDWATWKSNYANQMYFIPDFDETEGYYSASDDWYSYWGDILDGLFSWEAAWPLYNGFGGNYPGDISPDLPVLAGASAHSKGYMMSLSALQYKDSFNTNIYRAGELNLPTRMDNILSMTESPDFIQVVTWNNGPESNYFGNIWPEQNSDTDAAKYANDEWDHSGWQPLITSFMQAWKSDSPSSAMQPPSDQPIGALWYKTILQDAVCPANNSPEEEQYSAKPTGFDSGVNQLNYAIVVEPGATGYTLQAYTNGVALASVPLNPGLNYGAFPGAQAGFQMLQIISEGNISMVATGGRCISPGCPDCIYNMNYQVIGFVESSATSATGTCPYVCPLPLVSTKGVFAHYMVGVTTEAHVQQDVDDAVAMGFSAFALNVADPTLSFVTQTFNYMFDYVLATYPQFKLFLSMDVKVINNLGNYQTLLSNFMQNDAYLQGPDGNPFLSTFTSGGLQNTDWSNFLDGLPELPYFVPDFDDTDGYYTSDPDWWSYWGGLLQGTFSWEAAWPQVGISATTDDISLDQVAINGAVAHGKTYMIALSPLQYKDAYGSNYYREGSLNLPQRIEAILNLSPAPDFAEFITWAKSQYIGNLWPEQNTDVQPAFYANALASHNGWRPLITSFISAFQAGLPPSQMAPPDGSPAIGALWYNSIMQSSVCPSNGTEYTSPPDGFTTATDQLNWAIVVAADQTELSLYAISNGDTLETGFRDSN
ncbi:hypothetical protein B7494_g2922 [Chlorociboria aeruginascens]|nr:hypothetical protein B7494_g2922 [Chlorociboria aeruginascens]